MLSEPPYAVYCALVQTLERDPRVPADLRRTRFFEAAAQVTGPHGLGILQRQSGVVPYLIEIGGCREAVRHLKATSMWLLERNIALLRRCLDHGELRSPLNDDHQPLAPLAFDRAMVVFEQRAVDDYLQRYAIGADARRGIDRLLAACASPAFRRALGFDRTLSEAIRRQHIAGRCSFFTLETRIAIGQYLVGRLHHARDSALHRRDRDQGHVDLA